MDEIRVELAADGRAWIDGRKVATDSSVDMDGARAAALMEVASLAADRGRTVRVSAREPDGAVWPLLVHPSGRVEPEDAQMTPELTRDPDAAAVPTRLRPRTAEITAALAGGRELEAMRLAHRLQKEVAEQYGQQHPYALRCRELVAHATLVGNMPAAATELFISAAHDWRALNRTSAVAAAQRAYASWHQVQEAARAVWLGGELIELLRALGGETRMTAVRDVVARIDELQSKPTTLAG